MVESSSQSLIHLVVQFNDALNRGDVDGMLRLMTPDCVFENTYPPPDGETFSGPAVRAFWESFFRSTRHPHIEIEEIFALEDRCVMRWVYSWQEADGSQRHIRGIDLYRIVDSLIAEKLSYVKG